MAGAIPPGTQIPKFSGKKTESVDAFLHKVLLIGTTGGITDKKPLAYLVQLGLEEDAATWLSVMQRQAETDDDAKAKLVDYDLLAKQLRQDFKESKSEAELLISASRLKQRKDETVAVFFMRCRQQVDDETADMTTDEKKQEVFKKMYLKFLKGYVVKGLLGEILDKLPNLREIASIENLEKAVATAAQQAAQSRAGKGQAQGGGQGGAGGGTKIKTEQQLAEMNLTDEVSDLAKKFIKFASNKEKAGKLDEVDMFSIQKARGQGQGGAAQGGRGRGRGGGQGAAGGGAGRGRGKRYAYGEAPYACNNPWCGQKGHGWRECQTPDNRKNQQQMAAMDKQQTAPAGNQGQEMASMNLQRRGDNHADSFPWDF